MRGLSIAFCCFVALAATPLACGSGGTGDPTPATGSGLPRTRAVLELTSQELGRLCDWSADKLGGYGNKVQCTDAVSFGPYDDQATCVGSVDSFSPSCPELTVGDYEDCMNALEPDPCAFVLTDGPAGCAALKACIAGM